MHRLFWVECPKCAMRWYAEWELRHSESLLECPAPAAITSSARTRPRGLTKGLFRSSEGCALTSPGWTCSELP